MKKYFSTFMYVDLVILACRRLFEENNVFQTHDKSSIEGCCYMLYQPWCISFINCIFILHIQILSETFWISFGIKCTFDFILVYSTSDETVFDKAIVLQEYHSFTTCDNNLDFIRIEASYINILLKSCYCVFNHIKIIHFHS